MNKYFFLITIIMLVFLLTGCRSTWQKPLPNADIVYQTGEGNQKVLGTVNADGSGSVVINVGGYFNKPIWSFDESLIYGLANGVGVIGPAGGYPAFWNNDGKFKHCSDWGNALYIEDAGNDKNLEVIVVFAREIAVVDIEECEKVKVLVNRDYWGGLGINTIMGISYFPDTQDLVFGMELLNLDKPAEYQIIKVNLETGEEAPLAEGIHPAWSPDGSEIVYVQRDGIYIMKADGTEPRLLVKHDFVDSGLFPLAMTEPMPRWSPDGRWIIYHRCEDELCIIPHGSIYKVSADGGPEEIIIQKGVYPSWRP